MDFHSKTLNQDLIGLIDSLAQHITLPSIKELILPGKNIGKSSKYAKFGLLLLEDNSSGFFYRLADIVGSENQNMLKMLHRWADTLPGTSVMEVAHWLDDDDDIKIGLGMAAINAISQHVFTQADYQPVAVVESSAHIDRAKRSNHVGMVGYFAPVVKQLTELNIPLTVIELDPSLYQQQHHLTVTGDVTRLEQTDYILCTGSTLLNHSLDKLLQDYAEGRYFELIGPTCGCFADPLFARGVDQIGGSGVMDITNARSRIESGSPWGSSVSKFVMNPDNYLAFPELIKRLQNA